MSLQKASSLLVVSCMSSERADINSSLISTWPTQSRFQSWEMDLRRHWWPAETVCAMDPFYMTKIQNLTHQKPPICSTVALQKLVTKTSLMKIFPARKCTFSTSILKSGQYIPFQTIQITFPSAEKTVVSIENQHWRAFAQIFKMSHSLVKFYQVLYFF